ncbi:MAG: NAD(P)/FAD-dependent oxidoreductase [Pseudomonadales bacterium]|nr:NAD(P)/FAD-dependent oxidoreductase [Pseudomonadales bacterium]
MPKSTHKILDTLIIGAGISGIGAAIKLIETGINDFLILEKFEDLGGTWRDNTYPGCACDVPSAIYSYSFAQKPDWSRAFAGQAEILDYVRHTASEYGINPFIRYGRNVENAQWDEKEHLWKVTTNAETYYANKVISCVGYLHEPIIPNLPGLNVFNGEIFHSSRWDHSIDLSNKRVAVIGTGASAIQFVPEIQPQVKELILFQRTPQWILPKPDHAIPDIESSFFKLPFTLQGWRDTLFNGLEGFGLGFRRPILLKGLQKAAEAYIRYAIPDENLRKKVTPDYTLGCKRVLLSSNYYSALNHSNVDVQPTAVKEIKGNTIVGTNGVEREVDIIILGTGFYVTDNPISKIVKGATGSTLADVWQGSPIAYRGTTISGFPNFFIVLGPNLGIGNNSAFIVIESQINYIMSAIKTMRKKGLTKVDVKADKQAAYNRVVQEELQGTVWNTGGCSSYYIDVNGRNSVAFPWSTYKMVELLKRFDIGSYSIA